MEETQLEVASTLAASRISFFSTFTALWLSQAFRS